MTQDTVREIEESIQRDMEHVELGKALERLKFNRDFKAIISEGYLQKEAIRLVHLRADPVFTTPQKQADVLAQIDAIGGLLSYFRTLAHNATIAAKAIGSAEAMREEILAEEARNE
jgi:hypothetical protein